MKQNRIFDQNSSQKARSWHYNMDTNRAEAQFADGSAIAIDCLAIEDEYGNTPAQRAELDWLLYNNPLEYARMVLSGEIEHYLTLGCDHGKLKDQPLNRPNNPLLAVAANGGLLAYFKFFLCS